MVPVRVLGPSRGLLTHLFPAPYPSLSLSGYFFPHKEIPQKQPGPWTSNLIQKKRGKRTSFYIKHGGGPEVIVVTVLFKFVSALVARPG